MRPLVLVLTAACGGANPTPEPVANRAPPPPKPACSETRVAAIAKHLGARWNTPVTPIVRCTPGRFPTPGFFIEADDGETERAGVLADDGNTELVPFATRGPRTVGRSVTECATVDLDGDGVDEIVETWRYRAPGFLGSSTWLEIRRVVDHRFENARGPFTNVHHPDLGGCSGQVRLAGQTIVITVEHLPGIPPSDCLAPGTHTFALDNDVVVEIDPTRLSRR